MWIDEKQPDENANQSGTPAEGKDPRATQAPTPADPPRPRRRGFAAMDRERVREIASKGGRAAHAAGTAHQFNSDEARIAGRKGGMAPHVRRGGVRRRPAAEGNGSGTPQSERQGQGDGR
jgi:general stress protein YciG